MVRFLSIFVAGVSFGILQRAVLADTFGSGTNQFTIDFLNVGNSGNFVDLRWARLNSVHGDVAYNYRISTYEVSQGMILKAKALGLTNVTTGWFSATQPAAYLSWYEMAAFVNWLNTNQGHHPAYNLVYSGGWNMSLWGPSEQAGTGVRTGTNPYRHKDAFYWLPSEDEWYKAAYHRNDGVTANYWEYPTGSDAVPDGIDFGQDPSYDAVFQDGYWLEAPRAVDDAGQTASPYGTFGQGGNVWEVMESAYDGVNDDPSEWRVARGGSWLDDEVPLHASNRSCITMVAGFGTEGFRVASAVPATNHPPEVLCPEKGTVDCGIPFIKSAQVFDPDGDPLVVVWSVNGAVVQTNLVPGVLRPPPFPIPPPLPPIEIGPPEPFPTQDNPVELLLTNAATSSQASSSVTFIEEQRPRQIPIPPLLPPDGPWQVFLRFWDLPLGTNVITVAVSDGVNPPAECSTLIIVEDTVPPVITDVSATPSILWPPNNRMVNVTLNAVVEEHCSSAIWKVFKIECDEPHNVDDLNFVDDHTVSLRATRSGKGDGRVYTLWLRATDEAGNESEPVSVEVTVPHGQRNKQH